MKRKKILYISQSYPYPAVSGGLIKTLNTLAVLSREYNIHAVFISETLPAKKDLKYLARLGIRVDVFQSSGILASVKDDLLGLARHFFRGIPHYIFQYTYAPAFPRVKKLIESFQPDIIHIDHLNLAQYLPKEKREQWILEHHNVEAYLYWTRFSHTEKVTRKFYLFVEMILTYVYEFQMLHRFDHVFAISKSEKVRLNRMFFIQHVSSQPFAYPTQPIQKRPNQGKRILFVGILGWPPNEDALEWFVQSIFPEIRRLVPDAEFHIVGRPGPRYTPSQGEGILIHGFQERLRPFLEAADVFVLPFRMGGGLRLKALTALSAGLPVVTTPLGVDGLDVWDGRECLIAKDTQSFVSETVHLLQSKSLRERLSQNAQRFMRTHYGKKENDMFLTMYQRVTE